jgi:hypothetical protein
MIVQVLTIIVHSSQLVIKIFRVLKDQLEYLLRECRWVAPQQILHLMQLFIFLHDFLLS